jgi:hypothetical protein
MKHVYTARDGLDANFLRGLLEGEGVRAVVQGEALEETWGSLNLTSESLPSVWVDDVDLPRADGIVAEYRERAAARADAPAGRGNADGGHTTWACQNCGCRVEEQFTRCWRCGHDRVASQGGVQPA